MKVSARAKPLRIRTTSDDEEDNVTEDDDNLSNDDNIVKDDGLGDGEASEDEGLGEEEAVEDKDDLGDDDAEDVTEGNDNLSDADVDVAAVSGHGSILLPLSLLQPRFLVPVRYFKFNLRHFL